MLMVTKFGTVLTCYDWLPSNMIIWSNRLSKTRDKQKSCFYYQSAYGHQTWQGGNLQWWVPTHKATWPFDYVVL